MNPRFHLLVIVCVGALFGLSAACDSTPGPGALQQVQAPVINGTIDVADDYDSVVRVLSDLGICTGTLIHDRFVLTAAHCVCGVRTAQSGSSASVADASDCVRAVDVQTWTNQSNGRRVVADVIPHPDYRQTFTEQGFILSSTSDVALLQLRDCVEPTIEPSDLAVSSLQSDFTGAVVQAGFGAIDCEETPSEERRFGTNLVRGISGELIRIRSDGDDPIIHVGDSGGPLFLPDGRVVAVTSSSACNRLAQFTRTSLFSSWIREQTSAGLACIDGDPVEVGQDWICAPEYYSDGDYCDCGCGDFDPDCDDPLAIPTCGDPSLTCDRTGQCVEAPVDGWHVDPDKYGDGEVCHCNSGAPDPDCANNEPSVDCDDGEVCDGSGACVAAGKTVPDGWTCSAEAYADGEFCDCDCGVLDPDCRLDGDVPSTCLLDEVCTERASCEKASHDCVPAASLEPDAGALTLNTCAGLNSYATACGDIEDGSAEHEDVVLELVSNFEGTYELVVRTDGFEPVVYPLERACEDVVTCESLASFDSGRDAWVAQLTASGPSTRLIVVDGVDGCGEVEVEYRLIENLCESSTEVCDGVDNNCSGVVDDTGVQLCTPAPPNAFARECSGESGCLYACELGFADRDRILENGCEARVGFDVNSSVEVCDGADNDGDDQIDEAGAVGCPSVPNAIAASCSQRGACEYRCKAGFRDADADLENGCEVGDESTAACASTEAAGGSWLFALMMLGAMRWRRKTLLNPQAR